MLAYINAKKKITQYIKDSNLLPGDRMPTELELSEKLDISRLTLREALNTLKNEGVIHSKQGCGTFVACNYNHIANSLNMNYGISEMIEISGFEPGVADFDVKLVSADSCVARELNVEEGCSIVVCSRVRLADDKPVVFSHDYLSPRLAADFLRHKNEDISLYSFIEDDLGIQIGVTTTEILPVIADKFLSQILNVEEGSPLMKFRATMNDNLGVPLVYASEYLRPDIFRFIVLRRR